MELKEVVFGKLNELGSPNLVIYGREGCGLCNLMVNSLIKLQTDYSNINFYYCDLTGNELEANKNLGIRTLPTIVINKGKQEIILNGITPIPLLKKHLS